MDCFYHFVIVFAIVYLLWIWVPLEHYTPFGSLTNPTLSFKFYNPYRYSDVFTNSFPVTPNYFPNLFFPGWAPFGGGIYSHRSIAY